MARSTVRQTKGANLGVVNRRIKDLPVKMAIAVASRTAPDLTGDAHRMYDGGLNVYGENRKEGKYGPVDLVATTKLRNELRFNADATLVRAVLRLPYAKYVVGRYKILPPGRAAIPSRWKRRIDGIIHGQQLELGL